MKTWKIGQIWGIQRHKSDGVLTPLLKQGCIKNPAIRTAACKNLCTRDVNADIHSFDSLTYLDLGLRVYLCRGPRELPFWPFMTFWEMDEKYAPLYSFSHKMLLLWPFPSFCHKNKIYGPKFRMLLWISVSKLMISLVISVIYVVHVIFLGIVGRSWADRRPIMDES